MKYSIKVYTVRRRDNCATCTCGWPIDLDDSAFEIVVNGGVADAGFCSRECAEKAASKRFSEPKPCNSHGDDECPVCTGAGLL